MNILFSCIQAFKHSFVKPLFLAVLFIPSILLFTTSVYADDNFFFNSIINSILVKYHYVHYSEVIYTDTSRNQNGTLYTGGAPVNGFRLIDVRIYQPATGPGSGSPIKISQIPVLFSSGLYAPNIPLEQSDMKFQLLRTWSNNAANSHAFPLVLMYGGGNNSRGTLKLAEDIAAAGFIVAVPSAYGVDPRACPDCGPAERRANLHDGRAVITAAVNGQLGFNGNQIIKDANNIPIVGCVGGSSGAAICQQLAAGTSTLNANSLPGDNAADPRIRAVFAGDLYNPPTPGVNTSHFVAALGMYASGDGENWPRDYAFYSNASKRIFYDLTNAGHDFFASLETSVGCDIVSDYDRIYTNHLNTANDDLNIFRVPLTSMPFAFEHCSSQSLSAFGGLPANLGLAGTLTALLPDAPLSAISVSSHDDVFNIMTRYYVINFLRANLNNDSISNLLATVPLFPGLLNNIYVNSVPGIQENDFNLQNKQIDMVRIPGTNHYHTTISTRSGPIADPSLTPGAYSLGVDELSVGTMPVITPAFNFPLQNGNLPSSNSVVVNPNGHISLESSVPINSGVFAAPRMNRWFADHGSWTISMFGSVVCNNGDCSAAGPGPEGQVWVSNTPQQLKITFYKIFTFEFPNLASVSAQCTLFPDGHIRLEYDNSIPVPGVLTGEAGYTGSMTVGISNGRLHLDEDGNYNPFLQPKIVTFTNVMNGASTDKADAIYEVYTQGVPAVGTH